MAGLELSPDNQGYGPGGTDVTYDHTVKNSGSGTDTFNLAVVSSQGWTVTPSQSSVTVPAGNTANIQVTVSVPVGATVVDVTTVTAVSSYSPGVIDTATDTTQLGGNSIPRCGFPFAPLQTSLVSRELDCQITRNRTLVISSCQPSLAP